ncbi:MAG: hypothetical protein KC484_12705 [Colwelliaceae bacterium]|nr:hypothetical protein [Colwelliaceae bacterium]
MNRTEIFSLILKTQHEAYLGPQGFQTPRNMKEFEQYQVGFSVDKNGANLTGNAKGMWQKSWCVVAKDTELGDPYYIDLVDNELAVFTAVFNEITVQWESFIVASSLKGFLECIELLFHFTEQKEPQYTPSSMSIFDLEKLESFGMKLADICENTEFWKHVFIGYVEWLQDENV